MLFLFITFLMLFILIYALGVLIELSAPGRYHGIPFLVMTALDAGLFLIALVFLRMLMAIGVP